MPKKSAKKSIANSKINQKKITNKNSKNPANKSAKAKAKIIKSDLKPNKKIVKKEQKNNLKKDKKTKLTVSKKSQKKQIKSTATFKNILNNKTPQEPKNSLFKNNLSKNSPQEKNTKKNLKKLDNDSLDNKKNSKIKNKKNNKNIQPEISKPFQAGDFAVYPSHGVGKIIEIQNSLVAGQQISCYLMLFEKDKLTIKIPVNNAEKIGLRRITTKSQMEEVLNILRSGIKKLKGMWSRRAQEYETKINSGDIFLLAEVLRDLTRDIEDSERSYSERIIYETAIFRLASEYSIIFNTDIDSAKEKIINIAKDKIYSETKSSSKDDFDDFDLDDRKSKTDPDEEEDDEEDEEEEEDDDFNYNFDEIDDDEDDDKPKKKKK